MALVEGIDTVAASDTEACADSGTEAPIADWLNLEEMERDPYPSYARLREMGPVVHVPVLGSYLLTTHETVVEAERHPELFSALIPGEYVDIVTGGRSMLHKDDPEHGVERKAINPTLRPRAVSEVWRRRFDANTERFLDELDEVGPERADLVHHFGTPLAAQNLIDLLGFPGTVSAADMTRWSADYIDGLDNILRNQEIWDRARASRGEVDSVLDELISKLQREPDDSVTSHLLQVGLPEQIVRSNVHLTISGGVNEPKHAITSMMWALSGHPEQLSAVRNDSSLWAGAFDETLRWLSPIGLLARVTTGDRVWEGVRMPANAPVGLLIASANRDESVFENADEFDITRSSRGHVAFGSGVHQCAGRWTAKASVSESALPRLFERFPDLRLDPNRAHQIEGWEFRGFTSLPVTW